MYIMDKTSLHTRVEKTLWFEWFSIVSGIGQGCMDLYSIERPEILLNLGRQCLRQFPESNTIFYHVFEVSVKIL